MKDYSKKKILANSDKLECKNEFKLAGINNNNILPLGNNINIDILTEAEMVQNNLNKELNDIRKINCYFSNNNKNEISSQKINNEGNTEFNKRKFKTNKNNDDKNNYKDIPLTKFFQ